MHLNENGDASTTTLQSAMQYCLAPFRRYRISRRYFIASTVLGGRHKVRWAIEDGLTGRQVYLIARAVRRNALPSNLLRLSIPAVLIALIAGKDGLAILPMAAVLAVLGILASFYVDSQSNLGPKLAALTVRTEALVNECGRLAKGRSGLEPFGSRKSRRLCRIRRQIRKNCWLIMKWSAELSGRSPDEYTHESVSSLPRIILWSMNNPEDASRRVLLTDSVNKLINNIDTNVFDYTMQRVEELQIPEMKRPTVMARIRNALTLAKFSLVVGIATGVLGLYVSIMKFKAGQP